MEVFWVPHIDPCSKLVGKCLVELDARRDQIEFSFAQRDAKSETGWSTAVLHGFSEIEDVRSRDGRVTIDPRIDHRSGARMLACLMRSNEDEAPFGFQQL